MWNKAYAHTSNDENNGKVQTIQSYLVSSILIKKQSVSRLTPINIIIASYVFHTEIKQISGITGPEAFWFWPIQKWMIIVLSVTITI